MLAAGDQIEVLTTTSFAGTSVINLTGNALAQRICGNAADNLLTDGLGAADIRTGGAGNDTYVVRNAGTLIVEGVGSGTSDLVAASVSFTLAADDNVEVLSTTSSGGATAINLTGNALTQTIIGNAGANRLNGGAGLDTVSGGLGADVFVITTALGATNIDRVTDYSVAADQIEIENAVFTGIFAGSLNAAAFASNIDGMATTATQRIVYETDTGFL